MDSNFQYAGAVNRPTSIEAAEIMFAEETGTTLDLSPAAKVALIVKIAAAIQSDVAEETQRLSRVLRSSLSRGGKLEAITLPQLSYSQSDPARGQGKVHRGVMGRKATVKSLGSNVGTKRRQHRHSRADGGARPGSERRSITIRRRKVLLPSRDPSRLDKSPRSLSGVPERSRLPTPHFGSLPGGLGTHDRWGRRLRPTGAPTSSTSARPRPSSADVRMSTPPA